MKSIAVFCASSLGNDPAYAQVAYDLGGFLAKAQIRVIYGGSKLGLMGKVADGALADGGEVIGVLPDFMTTREIAHEHLSELMLVGSMQERKLKMHELSDAVIALPGGFGTLEELFEMVTWGQLGLHRKPIGILNFKGFYDHLILLLEHMTAEGLLKQRNADMLIVSKEQDRLLELMRDYLPPEPIIQIKKGQV